MAVDFARVVCVYAESRSGARVGSGYALSEFLVLTAGHVLVDAGIGKGDQVDVRGVHGSAWVPGVVRWLNLDLDAALVDMSSSWSTEAMSVLRWGRIASQEPISASAIGFPWSAERPDVTRDTEHAVGLIAPGTGARTGRIEMTVLTSAPAARPESGSPWAGMSGAGLVSGQYLVAVVLTDPKRYGTDRLVGVAVG